MVEYRVRERMNAWAALPHEVACFWAYDEAYAIATQVESQCGLRTYVGAIRLLLDLGLEDRVIHLRKPDYLLQIRSGIFKRPWHVTELMRVWR